MLVISNNQEYAGIFEQLKEKIKEFQTVTGDPWQ